MSVDKEKLAEPESSPEGAPPSPEEMHSTDIIRAFFISRIKHIGLEELLEGGPLTIEMIIEEGVKAMEREGGRVQITPEELRITTINRIIECTREGVKITGPSREREKEHETLPGMRLKDLKMDSKGRISLRRAIEEVGVKKAEIFLIDIEKAGQNPNIPPLIICDPENAPKGYIRKESIKDSNGRTMMGIKHRNLFGALSEEEDEGSVKVKVYNAGGIAVVILSQKGEYDPELIGSLFPK